MISLNTKLPSKILCDQESRGSSGDDDSRNLIRMSPDRAGFAERQLQAFRNAFLTMLRNEAQGAMTSYLFHDLTRSSDFVLSGGSAWERKIADNVTQGSHFWSNDQGAIAHAIREGLVDTLPYRIKLVSYGGGEAQAFHSKEGQIIRALQVSDREITDFCAVDILPRYAHTLTYLAAETYNLEAQGVRGDFLRNGRLAISGSEGIPVVMIFGGPFENVPIDSAHPDVEKNVAIVWAKLNIQHGLGSIVIKTFDSDQDPVSQKERYAPTKNFEAFELSCFARAVEGGIITNPNYEVFPHWRMATEYDTEINSVRLMAECKKDHYLPTCGGEFNFRAGDKRTLTLSHKWDIDTHALIAHRAGYELLAVFSEAGNPNPVMVARAVRDPQPDLLEHVHFSRK